MFYAPYILYIAFLYMASIVVFPSVASPTPSCESHMGDTTLPYHFACAVASPALAA